jgi:hypothetical protein
MRHEQAQLPRATELHPTPCASVCILFNYSATTDSIEGLSSAGLTRQKEAANVHSYVLSTELQARSESMGKLSLIRIQPLKDKKRRNQSRISLKQWSGITHGIPDCQLLAFENRSLL